MNANREWVEVEETSGMESAPLGVGEADSRHSSKFTPAWVSVQRR